MTFPSFQIYLAEHVDRRHLSLIVGEVRGRALWSWANAKEKCVDKVYGQQVYRRQQVAGRLIFNHRTHLGSLKAMGWPSFTHTDVHFGGQTTEY